MKEHNTENGADCWCEPKIIVEGDSRIFVHQNIKRKKKDVWTEPMKCVGPISNNDMDEVMSISTPNHPAPKDRCPKCGCFLTKKAPRICSSIECDYGLKKS